MQIGQTPGKRRIYYACYPDRVRQFGALHGIPELTFLQAFRSKE
jgi:hypothetical protein